jgi:hypothetical protein
VFWGRKNGKGGKRVGGGKETEVAATRASVGESDSWGGVVRVWWGGGGMVAGGQ